MIKAHILAWITHHGYLGISSLLALGVFGMPFPDEVLLTFAGYQVFLGRLRLVPAITAASSGAAVGITLSYLTGRLFGSALLGAGARRGFIPADRVETAREWFARRGR